MLKLLTSQVNIQEQCEQINVLATDFNRIYSFIYSEYSIYSQFNSFIWTVVILQFTLIRGKLSRESSNLNVVINMIMSESKANQLSQLIQCFDIVNSMFEQSQCEAEIDQIPELHLQTPIHSRIENLNIELTDEKDHFKDFIKNQSHCQTTAVESQIHSEIFSIREDYHSDSIHEIKPSQLNSKEICIERYDDYLNFTFDNGVDRSISESILAMSCIHKQSSSQASDKSFRICDEELDIEINNYSNNHIDTLFKKSKLELNYCSKHQSSSILKVMKRNSKSKSELVATGIEESDKKYVHENSDCEVSHCRRKLIRLSLVSSKKKKE